MDGTGLTRYCLIANFSKFDVSMSLHASAHKSVGAHSVRYTHSYMT